MSMPWHPLAATRWSRLGPLEATVARADRTPPPTLLSGPPTIRHVAKGIAGRNEVIGPCQRPRICGERVARTACRADHALQHCREGALVSAEADEHGPVVGDRAIGHVPTEDLSEEVLVGPCDVRIEWFVGEFETVEFRTPDHPLLLGYGKGFPSCRIMSPFLQEQHRAPGTCSVGDHRDLRRIDQRRVF